jgi:hypothetical protein
MQRCQKGLLRSLTYAILSANTALIPVVCSARWVRAKKVVGSQEWSVSELNGTLSALRRCAADDDFFRLRICFFIDGLDEFDANHR